MTTSKNSGAAVSLKGVIGPAFYETHRLIRAGKIDAKVVKLPLLRNPRAKMQGIRDGFVKIFCRPGTGIVVGGVVVAPRASELIHPISIAVDNNLTVEQIANAFTVYPSLSGSIAEVARQLHNRKASAEG